MSEVYTVKAKTVAEAMQLASQKYGGAGKELSYDIISTEKKGFLGIGSRDAEISVTVSDSMDADLSDIVSQFRSPGQSTREGRDEAHQNRNKRDKNGAPAKAKNEDRDRKAEQSETEKNGPKASENTNKPNKQQNRGRDSVSKNEQAPSKPAPKKEEPAAAVQKKETVKPAPKKNEPSAKTMPKKEEVSAKNDAKTEARNEQALKVGIGEDEMNFAVDFINKMIAGMKLSAAAAPAAPEGVEYIREEGAELYPAIEITGADTGILIGHHGETLDAIQYLANLALFRRDGSARGREHIRITVDIENYRAKREETLRALARRMAARAVKYKRNVFLEPMNPYERRIIHSELQDFEGVSTHSVGSDVNRKIVITYEGAGRAPQNNRRRGHGSKANYSGAAQEERVESVETSFDSDDDELSTASRVPLPTLDD